MHQATLACNDWARIRCNFWMRYASIRNLYISSTWELGYCSFLRSILAPSPFECQKKYPVRCSSSHIPTLRTACCSSLPLQAQTQQRMALLSRCGMPLCHEGPLCCHLFLVMYMCLNFSHGAVHACPVHTKASGHSE